MGHHLTKDGKFKSDKYPWCPEGFFPLKLTDEDAHEAILVYADKMLLGRDNELGYDLQEAVKNAGGPDQTPASAKGYVYKGDYFE